MKFIDAYKKKYPKRPRVLTRLEDHKLLDWADLTDENLRVFVEDLESEDVSQSTVRTYLNELKALFGYYADCMPSKLYRRILTVKGDASQATFLNESDIEAIDKYSPRTDIEEYVKRVFLISCLTGLRHTDAEKLTLKNISEETKMLSFVPQKTAHAGTKIQVPVHRLLKKYLDEETDERKVYDATFNETIRRICFRCGIDEELTLYQKGKIQTKPKWEFVASHTARRSFATNLYLRGIPIDTIAQFLGHTSGDMTRRYIVADRPADDKVLSFFN